MSVECLVQVKSQSELDIGGRETCYCIEPSYGGAPAIPMTHASLVIEVSVSAEEHTCGELGDISFYICPPSKLFDCGVAFHLHEETFLKMLLLVQSPKKSKIQH